ncbi:MAG: cytochrome c biogenesis protein CcsA, partial [Phycisphaeraceae bacterium]
AHGLQSVGVPALAAPTTPPAPNQKSDLSNQKFSALLVAAVTAGAAGLFLYRWLVVHRAWQPVSAHVDGLLLIAALLGGLVLYVQARPRITGFAAFALPLLALVLAWAICAAHFTYRPFALNTLHPLWHLLHLASVYAGTALAAVAAVAGTMFLYLERRLKRRRPLPQPIASLEAIETLIIRTATLGFALLTLGLVAGVVILFDAPADAGPLPVYAYAPKLALATLAWLAYALVMNVRHTSSFRGSRAAWLAIVGLVLLLATYGLVTGTSSHGDATTTPTRDQPSAISHQPFANSREVL